MKYKIGQYWKIDNGLYILSSPAVKEVVLINLRTGSRWTEAVKVNNCTDVTAEEFDKVIAGKMCRSSDWKYKLVAENGDDL